MEPQHVLVNLAQAGESLHKLANHVSKRLKIAGIPGFIVLGKHRAVPKPVVKNRFVRVGNPKAEIGKP